MADWLETATPVPVETMRDAAIDGGDWRFAALAMMADQASIGLPDAVLRDLARLAYGEGEVSELDARKVRVVADHLDRSYGHV